MNAQRPRTGLMNPPETDALEQLRKIVEPPTPKTLNAQIEALSDKQREQLNLFVSQLKLSMSFSRINDRYADYKTLVRQMYPRLDIELSELVTAVMESLDPTPEMPPEIKYKRSLERKLTPREMAMRVYDNPKYFPPRDAMKTEQVYSAPFTKLEPTRKPSPTLSKNDDVTFAFDNAALSKFKDTLGKIESANDYAVR